MTDMNWTIPPAPTGATWQDIVTSPAPPEDELPPPGRSGRGIARGAGLILAGLLVGTVAVTAGQAALRHSDTPAAAVTPAQGSVPQDGLPQDALPQDALPQDALPQAQLPGQVPQGQFGGRPPGDRGRRLGGEQHIIGTLTAVGPSSVTVRSADGTATYAVTSATDVERDGQQVALSSLRAGEQVLVHVFPTGSGLTAERVLAGSAEPGDSTLTDGRHA